MELNNMGEKLKGKCKWFSNKKSYGFITTPDGKDVFIHFTGIVMEGYKTLKDNQEVEFEIMEGEKGPQAVNCVPLTTTEKK